MGNRWMWRTAFGFVGVLALCCEPKASMIVGTWQNGDGQVLTVNAALDGKLVQPAPCAPVLNVDVRRDPYDRYALRFVSNQSIFLLPAQRSLFGDSEFFCSSKDSVPMCQFCDVEGDRLECEPTEQKIAGHGALVTHDCTWIRRVTSGVSVEQNAGCPATRDAGGCGMGSTDDRSSDGSALDAGVAD